MRASPRPLKEDDRLEDAQAPANGFVLLASIGIKRIVHSSSPAVRGTTTTWWRGERWRGRVSGHGYVTRKK